MRIISATVSNFSSYKSLSFDFSNKGLCLISGPTGSGKSALCDIIPWCLYGVTAKNGAADEVRSWNAEGPTTGIIELDIGTIFRSRGPNDLWYRHKDGAQTRGKDINDTQKLINSWLGVDADLFISGTYFHEFCQTAQFFSTSAKNRRSITEQMADLSLSKKLTENLTEYRKILKETKTKLGGDKQTKDGLVSHLMKDVAQEEKKHKEWETCQKLKISELGRRVKHFDKEKQQTLRSLKDAHAKELAAFEWDLIKAKENLLSETHFSGRKAALKIKIDALGDGKCGECGAQKNSTQRLLLTKQGHDIEREEFENHKINIFITSQETIIGNSKLRFDREFRKESLADNFYEGQHRDALDEVNPYSPEIVIAKLLKEKEELKLLETELIDVLIEISDVELLGKINEELRLLLVKNTIVNLEYDTNSMLSDYFEGEISVKFDISQADRIDTMIYKDGNVASYQQLSKGQRGLLKLCFGIAVMKSVANYNGFTPNIMFFDESLDGMSDTLKVQAFRLFQSLEGRYESIFAVDHSEGFKAEFTTKYEVELEGGQSVIR